MTDGAIVLANDLLRDVHAKTTHGLIRGPSRWPIAGVVDASCAGRDAGEVLDGTVRDIPIFASVREALDGAAAGARYCVLGVATSGGLIPAALRGDLLEAARAGLTLVGGMHELLADDDELRREVERSGGALVDLRRPRPSSELRFWTGEVLSLATPRVAVLARAARPDSVKRSASARIARLAGVAIISAASSTPGSPAISRDLRISATESR